MLARGLCVVVAGAAGASACGPGLEMIHESNVRFEHCYRLDMDPVIAPSHRLHCWRDWTHTYAEGQPQDRIEYARRRIIALESGDNRLVRIHVEPRPRARVFSLVDTSQANGPALAPAPTSAHAPPPTLGPKEVEQEVRVPESTGKALPQGACSEACQSAYRSCAETCPKSGAACTGCTEDYAACMRRCFD